MTRTDIRYALFRCRSGNPTPEQKNILAPYLPVLKKLDLPLHEFSETWDIGTIEPFDSIVTGGKLMLLQEARDESVINEDGTPKDAMVASIVKKKKIK